MKCLNIQHISPFFPVFDVRYILDLKYIYCFVAQSRRSITKTSNAKNKLAEFANSLDRDEWLTMHGANPYLILAMKHRTVAVIFGLYS